MKKNSVHKWWADNPMTYGDGHGESRFRGRNFRFGSKEQRAASDAIFVSWNQPLHNENFFGRIFDYKKYCGAKVLEIGCGLGFMASLWASNGANLTAVDLNPVSISQTKLRFKQNNLNGELILADARNLPFSNKSFDYIYSWGVLHHSTKLQDSLKEIARCLKGGGEIGVMLYNRRSILYGYEILYREGFLNLESRYLNPLELASRYSDGGRELGNPHTWPVTKREIRNFLSEDFTNIRIRILGTDLDYLSRHLIPVLSAFIPKSFLKPWARRFGWSLWVTAERKWI